MEPQTLKRARKIHQRIKVVFTVIIFLQIQVVHKIEMFIKAKGALSIDFPVYVNTLTDFVT